jgi:hypothetical protein
MKEGEEGQIIHSIERSLGLDPESEPTWGYDLSQAFFPEEAPTPRQRKFAGWCLRNLSFFVAGYEVAAKRGQIPSLTPSHVQAFCYQEKEELRNRWGEAFADFTILQVLGSAKRHIAWLQELKSYEETPSHDQMLKRLQQTHRLLELTIGQNGMNRTT